MHVKSEDLFFSPWNRKKIVEKDVILHVSRNNVAW